MIDRDRWMDQSDDVLVDEPYSSRRFSVVRSFVGSSLISCAISHVIVYSFLFFLLFLPYDADLLSFSSVVLVRRELDH